MESQVLHTVWCNISGEAAGEIWHWSLRLESERVDTDITLLDTDAKHFPETFRPSGSLISEVLCKAGHSVLMHPPNDVMLCNALR